MLFLSTTKIDRMPEKATEWPLKLIYIRLKVARPTLANNNALHANVAIIAINAPQYASFS
jgi:hypothetical protein